jgi:hypothetical protein
VSATAHLRVYRFGAGTRFDGGLIGAVERTRLAGGGSVLDALFVGREPDGSVVAVDLATGLRDGTFMALLDFRLDASRRRAITRRTLAGRPGGVDRALVETAAASLAEGEALLAILAAQAAHPLAEAADRAGGRLVEDREVACSALAEVSSLLSPATP